MESHVSSLLSTFVVSLLAAFAGGLAARSLKLPPLLGYLLAGIAVGPFTPGFIANQAYADEFASIGVTLLMFNIGMHFSIKDLMAVKRIALLGGALQVVISAILGTMIAWVVLDHRLMASILIGLSVAIASTAVSVRLLEDRHQITTFPGRVALGWLVVQDVAVVFALVLLPVFGKSGPLSLSEVMVASAHSAIQIVGFALIMLGVGRRAIPAVLGFVARAGSRELFTLSIIVIALGIAYAASVVFGVSLALGAFAAGVVIGESDLKYHAASEVMAMQQIFTILFFVSVGMLFDLESIVQFPWQIVILWGTVVLGMGGVTFLILLAMRVPIEAAALVGAAFAQIGEFSFVLGELGIENNLLARADRDLILAVAIVAIALNPVIVSVFPRLARRFANTHLVSAWYKEGATTLPKEEASLEGHVILIGHGRVGRLVSEGLAEHNIPFVVIESDRRIMEKLRHSGKSVVFGDASREAVLRAASPATAKLMILAVPEGAAVRRIVGHVKRQYPKLEVIARVHSETDARTLAKLGAAMTIMGEKEIALGLSAHALQKFDLESHQILETIGHLRQSASL